MKLLLITSLITALSALAADAPTVAEAVTKPAAPVTASPFNVGACVKKGGTVEDCMKQQRDASSQSPAAHHLTASEREQAILARERFNSAQKEQAILQALIPQLHQLFEDQVKILEDLCKPQKVVTLQDGTYDCAPPQTNTGDASGLPTTSK
jgi:hypothetical protein